MNARRTKFYLDKRNARFLGVCSGIADYTGIDAVWVRVATVLLTIIGGFPWTVIAYFITAWVADNKPREFYDMDPEEEKFWQGVRAKPRATVRDVRSRFATSIADWPISRRYTPRRRAGSPARSTN